MKIYKKLTTLLIIIVVLLLSATPVLSPLLPARANPDWTKDANPVFVRGYLATAPFVLYDGGTYKMWYTQQSATLTTFDNLLNNIRALGITSLVNHLKSHSFSAVASGDSVTVKAIINYLATHASEVQNLLSSMNSAIGYTTSADGTTWSLPSTALPVTSGQWDKFYVGTPSIIKNSSTNYEMWYTGASVDASAVNQFLTDLNQLSSDNVSILLQDIVNNNVSAFVTHARHARPSGDSYLFTLITDIIGIINNTNFAIGRATSTDGGLSWNKYGTAAVLPKGSGTDWDRHGVGAPSVIKDSSGTYHMWYTGFGIDYGTLVTGLLSATDITAIQNTILAAATMAIGHATSPDGIIWTRDGSNPVLPNGASTDWDSYGVGTPSVLRDSSGNYQMWYTGAKLVPSTLVSFITGSSPFDTTLTSGVNVAIGHATSSSGVGASWTKDASYVVPKGTGSAWDKYGVAAPSVAAVGSYYYMWYTGGGTSLGTLATNILNGNSLDTALNNGNTRLAIGHASTPIPVVSTGVAMGGGGGAVVTPPAAGTTPVTDYVDTSGTFKQMVTARSDDSNCSLTIPAGTNALANGIPLTQITMVQSTSPTSPPANFSAIGLVYTFGPAGTIFSTPVTLTFTYNLSLIPAGLSETSLFIAQFDANVGAWVKLPCSVDTELHTITAQVSGFSDFTILISTRPAAFTTSYLNISPAEANIGETVKISLVVANTGDFSGSYTVNLKINNTIVDSKAVTLTGGASQPVTFTTTRNAAGTYTVTVDSLSGTFTVKATPTPTPTLTPTPTPTPTLTPTPTTTPTPSPTLTPTPSRTPTPTPTPIPGVAAGPNWWLIGGIIAGVIIVVLIVLIIIRRTSE